MQPQMGQPVAQPVAQPAMSKMRVTVPAGVKGGQPLQVQTPSGLMQVLPPSAPQTPLTDSPRLPRGRRRSPSLRASPRAKCLR